MYSKKSIQPRSGVVVQRLPAGICNPRKAEFGLGSSRRMSIERGGRAAGDAAFFTHESTRTSALIPIIARLTRRESMAWPSPDQTDYP